MVKNRLKGGIPLAGDPEVKMPKFNFSDYDGSGRTVYHNNDEYIDFVTYNGALYVCMVPTIAPTTSAPNEGFLKLVDKGEVGPKGTPGRDGASAIAPRIGANFINDQLAVTVNDRTVAVSPSLTGPSWKPVREGDHLTWELTDDRESPDDINLMDLRPVDKCPLLLRVDSDNTKRSDEVSGPARFIQWKYEGDKYWTNLISISELMNLALCGICFWYDKHDQEWHYGHKEVIRADYASDKNGRKIISRVKLGDVLFDAGVLPINDYGVEIELINQRLAEIEDDMVKSISINGGAKLTPDNDGNVDLPIDLSDYAKKNWVDANFQPVGDYIEGIRVNGGRVNRPENGIVNLEIEEGGSGDDSDCVKSVEIDGDEKFPVNGKVSFNLSDKYNLFDLVYRNGHLYKVVNGNETDLGEFGPSGEGGEGDGVGVDNIQFRINSSTGKLEFRMSVDGEWQSWNPIDLPASSGGEGDGVGVDNIEFRVNSDNELEFRMSVDGDWKSWNVINLPSGTSGEGDGVGIDDIKFELQDGQLKYQVSIDGAWEEDWHSIPLPGGTTGGEHVDLQITSAGMLQIRYDGGQWQDVGLVNSGSSLPNAFVNVSITNNKLTFTRNNGTTQVIDLPNTGEGSVVSVQQILGSGVHIATITVDGIPVKIYAPNGSGPDDPDDPDDPQPTKPSYRTFMVYQRTNSPTEAPSTETITAAVWNLSTDELDLTSEYWNNHPGNAHDASDACLWMTSATFSSEYGARIGDWEEPICLTSSWGDGADSNKKEFIYRSLTEAEYEVLKSVRPVKAIDDNRDDNFPPADALAERQWIDNPTGITPEYPYEIGSYRRRVDGVWQEYSMPYVWSHWGEDGVDGDGVEYVYRRAVADEVDEANNSITLKASVERPSNAWAYDSAVAPWTDDPSGVSSEYPYEFCAQRKTVIVENAMVWGPWSEPALWGIYKKGDRGPEGPSGGPGPAGPRGDDYEKVYGLAGNALPASKSIDATQEDANGKTSADDGYLPKFVFDGVPVDATATPTGVSEHNRYEYESIRRKHNGVWGPFSAPALHSNFVEAGLTDDQLENIKHDVEDAIGQDLADAQQRLTDAEGRLDAIDGEGSTFLQDNASSLVQILTNYEDEDQKSFADLVVDGKKATIEQWAASKVANDLGEESLVSVKSNLDGINGVIGNYADYTEGGELKTVKQLLDAKAATAEIAATYATQESVTSARTEWNAEAGRLQSSVAKATYVWVKYDEDDNVVDVKPFDGEDSMPGYEKKLSAEAMTAIRQSASEVDIIAGVADNWAQIIAKADEDGSSIILDADHINLVGDASAERIAIQHAEIVDAEISNATITDATINDCVINSSITSDNYDNVNKRGFMIDPENGDFAFYADNAKFDSDNGLQFDGDQTISWDDIDGRPESLEDLDPDDTLSTFITRDSLTTNKITANEIDASDLEVAAANITGKLEANQIKVEDIEIGSGQITGKLEANQIKVEDIEIEAGQITGKLTAGQIDVDNLNVKVGKFDYLTVGGTAIGENNTLNIEFANGSIPSNPDRNTIYFIY